MWKQEKKKYMTQNSRDMKKGTVQQRRKQNEKQNESKAKGTTWKKKKKTDRCHEILQNKQQEERERENGGMGWVCRKLRIHEG